jgi:branched-chain amino acid transport system permease protein
MTGGVLLQAVVAGAGTGAGYALVAMGFALCWSLTRTFALAHGDIAISAVLLAVAAVVGSTPTAQAPGVLDSSAIAAGALALGAGFGAATHQFVVRPAITGHRPEALTWGAGLLVAGIVLRAAVGAVFAGSGVSVPDVLHLSLGRTAPLPLGGGGVVPVRSLVVLGVAAVVALGFDRVLAISRWGREVRAVADDPALAGLCGIPAQRRIAAAFAATGGAAALAGLLVAPGVAVDAGSGVQLALAGGAAAVLVRAGSLRTAAAVALAIGVAQQLIVLGGGPGVTVSDLLPAGLLVLAGSTRTAAVPRRGAVRAAGA